MQHVARFYTGVGTSRHASTEMLRKAYSVGKRLAMLGFVLRSGAAPQMDSAFEEGALAGGGQCEIWLPWNGFNNRFANERADGELQPKGTPTLRIGRPEFEEVASTIHPVWSRLSDPVKKLHARNVGQVMGCRGARVSDFLVCYTPDGADAGTPTTRKTGGTATAIKLALQNNVPVFNMANPMALHRLADWLRAHPFP